MGGFDQLPIIEGLELIKEPKKKSIKKRSKKPLLDDEEPNHGVYGSLERDAEIQDWFSEVSIDVGEFDEEFLEFLEEVGPTRCSRVIELLHGMVNAKFISVSANTSKVDFSQKMERRCAFFENVN
ncbi:hypothetical protein Tco_0344866 [Tanacetum coccineum]